MNNRLIYVMGPSGAGKDSVLSWVKAHLAEQNNIHWVKRTITRVTDPNGEAHESVTTEEFERLRADDAFSLVWHANQLDYGIRHIELAGIKQGCWVFLNGSREYLSEAAKKFPGLSIVHITADRQIIAERLIQRGRESADLIASRLARQAEVDIPLGSQYIEIFNNSTIELAGQQLIDSLCNLDSELCSRSNVDILYR